MAANVFLKQGASFELTLAFANEDGTPVDLTTVTLASQVRDSSGNLVAQLAPTATSTAGQAQVSVLNTSAWPIGRLSCDVKVTTTATGVVALSETFGISVQQAITQPVSS